MDLITFVLVFLVLFAVCFVLVRVGISLFCYLFGSSANDRGRGQAYDQIRHSGQQARQSMDQASNEYLAYLQQELRRK